MCIIINYQTNVHAGVDANNGDSPSTKHHHTIFRVWRFFTWCQANLRKRIKFFYLNILRLQKLFQQYASVLTTNDPPLTYFYHLMHGVAFRLGVNTWCCLQDWWPGDLGQQRWSITDLCCWSLVHSEISVIILYRMLVPPRSGLSLARRPCDLPVSTPISTN